MYKQVIKEFEEKMKKTISVYKEELLTIRAGRANPALVENIMVPYYGVATPLKQVASISAPEARLLIIQPWDANLMKVIEKEIQKSNLGITPSNDGKIIRLPFPVLTEERRKELVKVVKKYAENSKVALRNSRRDALEKVKKLEKDSLIREDERINAEEEIKKLIEKYTKEIDRITKNKETELLEI